MREQMKKQDENRNERIKDVTIITGYENLYRRSKNIHFIFRKESLCLCVQTVIWSRDWPKSSVVTLVISALMHRSLQHFSTAPRLSSDGIFYCSFSQSTLTQPTSVSEALRSTARLSCTLKSGISVGGKNIYWYKQMQGSPPQYFLYYYSDSDKKLGPGVTNRVSGSKDTSKNAANLHISELQAEDEGDYYCAIWESSVSHSVTGRWGSRHKP
ncbi:hypothetical protein STEG23_025248 [Scotinomys teguina]